MASVKKELFSGVAYTAVAQYFGVFISLLISAILARMVSPQEFGIVAIATVIITFFGLFTELGIAPAVIQNKELTQDDLNKIFSFTIWMGLGTGICFFAAAWPIASFYQNGRLLLICQLLSVDLFFAAINIVPNAVVFKNKRFKFIAVRSLAVQLVGGSFAVAAALMGAGVYSLLINPIITSIVLFFVSIRLYPQRVVGGWGFDSMRKILSFSLYQFFFNLINYFSRNLDKLLIGKFMGLSTLGYYDKSYRLMMLPLQNITAVITPVMHPIFSQFQHDLHHLQQSYLKVVRFLAFLGFPLSVFAWFTARETVLLIFGPRWEPSVAAFQILALSVGIQIILSSSGSIFQAANSTKVMFFSGLLSAVLNVTGILVGVFVFKTLVAVAWGMCVSFTINFIQCYVLMYAVTFKTGMAGFWRQFVSPLCLSGLLLLISLAMQHWLPVLPLFPCLVLKSLVYLLVFVLYIQLSKEYDMVAGLKRFLKKT